MDDGVGSFDRVDLVAVDDQGSEERSRAMMIIECDFHTRYQQIAMMNDATGELTERAGGTPLNLNLIGSCFCL